MSALWVIQAVIAAALILFIMLQSPRGEGLGAIGGSATLFKVQKKREKVLRNVSLVLAIAFTLSTVVLLIFG
ncbi:MAG: preprotein translocase subunit SecG [Caldiserica bacterium]|jgi:preprotein translocase subunit SecG|nr:preprotein translocase subunit SecG [Caldisericota bacterium]MDH7562740.1 preprotein translocase subunit SecG [Caldisericota bacterium]